MGEVFFLKNKPPISYLFPNVKKGAELAPVEGKEV